MTTTAQLSFGKQITGSPEILETVLLTEVANMVRTDAALLHLTGRLRKLAAFDRDAYRTAKTSLPYVVGSLFASGVRRLDALETATFFVLDLDHCTELNGRVPDSIRADWSVAMAFVSPSGEGLKLFFRLLEPCTDAKTFSAAYRNFAGDFGVRHGFVRSVDLRTADATRACFLAHDADVYENPDAMPVDWRLWLPNAETSGLDLFGGATDAPVLTRKPAVERPINEKAYREVLHTINPNGPVRRPKQTFVPNELTVLEPVLRRICADLNWELFETTPLNHGLKVVVKQGFRRAEVNVHYGKKGYSVVRSPKTGTDPALSDLLYAQLYQMLFSEPTCVGEVLMNVVVSMN